MPLTASSVLSRLGGYIKQDKSQSDQARYLLPFVLLMRLDSKLAPTRSELREVSAKWDRSALADDVHEGCLEAMEAREITGLHFYNVGPYDLAGVKDKTDVLTRVKELANGFSLRVRTLLVEKLRVLDKASDLHKETTLFGFVGELAAIQAETADLDDEHFGRLLSDLLQLLSEGTNDDASECATPRDVVDLMVALLPRPNAQSAKPLSLVVYDPTYGTAGLVVRAAAYLHAYFGGVDVAVSGHEKRAEMYAIGELSALLQVSVFNRQSPADSGAGKRIVDLSSLNCLHPEARRMGDADYAVCNPPQGKSGKWDDMHSTVLSEARIEGSRFARGTPAVGDASLLFVQHILDRLKATGRAVIVLNGSPFFAGQVSAKGDNEQAIRSWLLDKDYVDAIVALPPNLHFNTDIPTYLWVLDKQRSVDRKGRVVLINAAGRPETREDEKICFASTQRNQNKKRFRLSPEGIASIVAMVERFEDVDLFDDEGEAVQVVRIVPTDDFRFRVVKVYRPLRRRVGIDDEGLARLSEQQAWRDFQDKDKDAWSRLHDLLEAHRGYRSLDAGAFEKELKTWTREAGLKTPAQTIRSAILTALSERDPEAVPVRDPGGKLVSDPDLADEERVPWNEDTQEHIAREVRPFVAEEDRDLLWTDPVELPGAEIAFNRIFYRYKEPRKLEEIASELRNTRREVDRLLDALEQDLDLVVGSGPRDGSGDRS